MTHRLTIVLALLIAFGAGWTAALIAPSVFGQRVSSDWFDMHSSVTSKGFVPAASVSKAVAYSFDAFAKSDIPLPEVKAVKGTAKFVIDTSASPSMRLGYRTTVEIATLDLSKIPVKYRKEKRIDVGGGKTITQLPIDQVTYEATFNFVLMDKDGFTLLEIPSASHTVESGKVNSFQSLAPEPIPVRLASQTARILLSLHIIKCVTCEED